MSRPLKTHIIVRTTFEGVHRYADAPEEVAYLRQPHRHQFGVEVEIEVFHDDRELEFIMVKHRIENFIELCKAGRPHWDMDKLSCEQVAICLANSLESAYGKREMIITIDEDGENGARVYFNKENE